MLFKKELIATIFFVLFSIAAPAFAQVDDEQINLTDGETLEIGVTPIPSPPVPGEENKLKIDFINKDTEKIQVHIDYFVNIFRDDNELFSTERIHTSSGTVKVPFTFNDQGTYKIVVAVDGILFVPMPKESATFTINVGTVSEDMNEETKSAIPNWIRNNAKWWAEDAIEDSDFTSGIQFLIKEDIIQIPETTQASSDGSHEIPSWIKNNADWWSQGLISDDDFLKGIQFLVEQGIIRV